MSRSGDEHFMALAIAQASAALGRTHPDPAAGAVLVKAGKVIGAGFQVRAGALHAEAVALAQAGRRARGATLYATFEPCNLFGRTPPCSEVLIAAGVTRVVFGSSDPNPLVTGKGLRRLRKAGLEVVPGLARAATDKLNRPFFKFVTTGLPWVTVKAGVTLDGKLATASGESKWITSGRAREAAHHLRDRVDALIVGARTVMADDPLLTTRLSGGRTPVRVVLDGALRSPLRSQLFRGGEGRVIVATLEPISSRRAKALLGRGVEVWSLGSRVGLVPLETVLRRLATEGLLHVLVEGGATTHGRFLSQGLADEVVLFVAPKLFGHGGLTWSGALGVEHPEQALRLGPLEAEALGPELILRASVLQQR